MTKPARKRKLAETPDEVAMPLVEHLKELRMRLLYSMSALLVGFLISYLFAGQIYQFLLRPLAHVYGAEAGRRLIYTGLAEAFLTYLKLAVFGGFILAFPVIAHQLYRFLAPGLYKKEREFLLPVLVAAPILFMAGALLVYYFVLPMAWKFFLSFETGGSGGSLPIQLEARVSEYLSLVMALIMGFGLAFQLPVVLVLLCKAGLVKAEALVRRRKFAIVGIFALAAVMTPPDVLSQVLLAIPLLLLYEMSIFACKRVEKKAATDA
jgi:sec-independent protein translocase protein TatC